MARQVIWMESLDLIMFLPLDQIRISYVGYTSQLVKLDEVDFSVDNYFLLQPININLQEVTVYSNSATSGKQSAIKFCVSLQ